MKTILSILVAFALVIQIFGHSYISSPASRGNQAQTQTGCVLPSCAGPCERPASQAGAGYPTSRGAAITISWPRNNHPGGFVRFAWAKTSESDSMATFDSNIDQYRCFESPASTCKPGDPAQPNGNDGPNTPQTACSSTIIVPGWLTDGKWTLQWAWFGGGYFLGDYYGCVDYAVSGGATSAKQNPIFYGGDYANQGVSQCKYFNTDKLHLCGADGCTASQTAGQPTNGIPQGAVIGILSGPPTPSSGTVPPVSGSGSGGISGSTDNTTQLVACNSDFQCSSGICQSDGYCYVAKGKKLDGGGIAAIVFAMVFVAVVAFTVIFVVINKSEWSNWRPFNKKSSGGGGFSS